MSIKLKAEGNIRTAATLYKNISSTQLVYVSKICYHTSFEAPYNN
jgi:hypothetical protein